jgi:hypothetical protein
VTTEHKKLVFIASGILFAVGLVLFWSSWWLPPQIGWDEEVFSTVDALFTAVNSRDLKQLSDCEQRLKTYQQSGKLPAAAAGRLDSLIQQARAGEWKLAAQRLYDFMLGQRRGGG